MCLRYVDVVGSHHYSAPEVTHSVTSDDRADVWSVGCIALHMVLTGLRGIDDMSIRLDDVKYSPSSLSHLIGLADEVTLFDHSASSLSHLIGLADEVTLFDHSASSLSHLVGLADEVTLFDHSASSLSRLIGLADEVTLFDHSASSLSRLIGLADEVTLSLIHI